VALSLKQDEEERHESEEAQDEENEFPTTEEAADE